MYHKIAILILAIIISAPASSLAQSDITRDDSASFLARVQEIPVETHAIAVDIGNSSLVQWHIAKLQGYWGAFEISRVSSKNQQLGNELSASISNLTGEAAKSSPNRAVINQTVAKLDSYLVQSVQAGMDQAQLQNSTVRALAIEDVLDEASSEYNNAIGHMNVTGAQVSNATAIANFGAYQTAEALANVANNMWNQLRAGTQNADPYTLRNLDSGFAQVIQAVDGKKTAERLTMVLQEVVYPNLAALYNLQMAGHANAGTPTILERKRIDYLSEPSSQRHSEHLKNSNAVSPYKADLNYLLNANGTITTAGTGSNQTQPEKLSLFSSIFKSTATAASMDLLNGTVSTANGNSMMIQSGFVYYLPSLHKVVVFGYIPQKQNGVITGVQVMELWCTTDGGATLPTAASDAPLGIRILSPESRVGPDWLMQATGQLTLAH